MKFPIGSTWHFSSSWSNDRSDRDVVDAEVFVVIDDAHHEAADVRETTIVIISDPSFPHREGHIMSFIPPGNYWKLSQRIA